jgi:hypothetical protein
VASSSPAVSGYWTDFRKITTIRAEFLSVYNGYRPLSVTTIANAKFRRLLARSLVFVTLGSTPTSEVLPRTIRITRLTTLLRGIQLLKVKLAAASPTVDTKVVF